MKVIVHWVPVPATWHLDQVKTLVLLLMKQRSQVERLLSAHAYDDVSRLDVPVGDGAKEGLGGATCRIAHECEGGGVYPGFRSF